MDLEKAASTARESGRFDEAVELYRQAIELNPNDANLHNELGLCFLGTGRPTDAAAAFERSLSMEPGNSQLHFHMGIALQNAGNHIAAAQSYRKAINLAPEVARNYSNLGHLILIHGNAPGAIKCFRKVHELEPETALGLMHLAMALVEEGDQERAAEVLRRVVEIDPSSADGQGVLGFVLQQLGEFEEAETHLHEAVRLQPTRAVSYFNIAYGKRMGPGDTSTIDSIRELLASGMPNENDARHLHYALGKAFDDLGRYGEAIRQFDEANRLALENLHRSGRRFDPQKYADGFDQSARDFTRERFYEERGRGSASEMPIFIVGLMRSGTTLVEQILSSHPDVGAGGELRFWLNKGPEVLSQENPTDVAAEYLQMLEGLGTGRTRITDKMPHNFEILGPIHSVFPKARIIHCKRFPVDNALSIYVTPYRTSPEFAHDRDNIVFASRQHKKLMEHWRNVIPSDQFFEVQYEELVEDRERLSREMLAFCGLPWDDAVLHPEANLRTVKTASLWQVRQSVYNRSVARWKGYEPWLGAFRKLG